MTDGSKRDHQQEGWFLLNDSHQLGLWKLKLFFAESEVRSCCVVWWYATKPNFLHYPNLLSTEAAKSTKEKTHLYQVPWNSFKFNLKNLNKYRSWSKRCSFGPNRFSPRRHICPGSLEGLKHAALIISILMSLIRSLSGSVCAARMWRAQVRPAMSQEQALLHHRFYSIIS